MNDLDIEGLVGSVLQGVLGGRGPHGRGALRYLAGGGRSSFLNASTLLAVAGVAWGLWETAQAQATPAQPSWTPGGTGGGLTVPPPIPPSPAAGVVAQVVPPPLPMAAQTGPPVPPEVLRVLRVTLAAARADGDLAPRERDAILTRARELGAEPLITAEIDRPHALADIVAGVGDPQAQRDLYTLAFAIVRADETITDQERAWLTGLAGQLHLDPATSAGLEQQAASRILAAAEGAER